jgi:hypothetical protein
VVVCPKKSFDRKCDLTEKIFKPKTSFDQKGRLNRLIYQNSIAKHIFYQKILRAKWLKRHFNRFVRFTEKAERLFCSKTFFVAAKR